MFPLRFFFILIKEALEWIIIKKMAQPKMDFSVFKPKRSKRAEEQENSAENTAKSIPNPKAVKEQEAPVQEPKAKQSQEDIPVSSETKNERKSELTALELQVDQSMSEQKESEESGKVIQFRMPRKSKRGGSTEAGGGVGNGKKQSSAGVPYCKIPEKEMPE